MIVLDDEARCALYRALLANRHVRMTGTDFLRPLMFITGRALEKDSGFVKIGEALYQELAFGEIERLNTPAGERSLKCKHTSGIHKEALERFLVQISPWR